MNSIEIVFSPQSKIERDLLIARIEEYPVNGLLEEGNLLKAYFIKEDITRKEVEAIAAAFSLSFEWHELEERNWNQEWEKHIEPIIINKFCGIRADFHPSLTGVKYELIITPKMAFGTGYHATTRLMIEFIEQLDIRGKRVLDFGCGTGVLAILAKKMGASFTLAIDNDEWAIHNAIENSKQNDCAEIIVKNDKIEDLDCRFDCIFANITRNTLLVYMDVFRKLLNPGGNLLLSGFLTRKDEDIIRNAAAHSGFDYLESRQIQKWAAALFQK